ncbi:MULTISPECIES: response regulator transcription factor [unclassified Bacillus (in: firmicutes)]|uniref:response regulator transcription factor n=1 Tax=unclassified Bacillus (in: firmicutes) TaxID=185979 RepID=UPI0008E8106E|nr:MULTISPECIES: response regulator transcription factor [unclassified Bacillus (in: firmicutes)]SFB11715.1 AraC-type DNA-binding protein [Bacillus sp. UNCCL13]SFQ90456.1 AraC-type DNA-binding protein [Bacillus sp. cl95]
MSFLTFSIPPFPTLIKAGDFVFQKGTKHFKRTYTVFDLLYVRTGTLYITEDNKKYEVSEGQYLILRPGLEHFGHKNSLVTTEIYWLHFQMEGNYSIQEESVLNWAAVLKDESTYTEPARYIFKIPCYGEVEHLEYIDKLFENIVSLADIQTPEYPLRQQIYFNDLILQLQIEAMRIPSATERLCEDALKYIRKNFQKDINMEDISKELLFHPDYITRCMQKTLGMSPVQYLNHYRISQAKRLLVTTNDKVMTISHEVGISDHTYFSKLFKKYEGTTPLEYRKMIQRIRIDDAPSN